MLHLSQDDIDYLKPSHEANFIQHSPSYIKSGSESNSKRAIFYGVDLEPYEVQQVENLNHELSHSGLSLNNSWGDRELLKYLYASNFNIHKAVANLKESVRWRTEVQLLPVTDRTLEVLHSGVIYPFGRDNQSRPILIINLEKLDTRIADKNELSVVINFYLDSLKQFSFLQGKIENLILIIDAGDKEYNDFPFEKFDAFLKKTIASHPAAVEKVYILGASSSFRTQYHAVKSSLENDSFDKVQFLSSNELYKLRETIPQAQLETKYGGIAPNVTNYWPISAIGPHRKSYVYEAPVQTHERYTSSGVYGNISHFDFDTTEHKKIYERTTMALPVTHIVEEHVVKSAPPVQVHEEPDPETKYDFNDEALLDLISGENEFIRNNTDSHAAKHLRESLNLHPTSTVTYQVEIGNKSSTYQTYGQNSHIEDWSMKKYLKSAKSKDEDDEARVEFCGLCVSKKKTPKH